MSTATTEELIRPVTASLVQVQHRAITGVPLQPGVTPSPVAHRAAAVALTVVRAVHQVEAAALTPDRVAPAAAAALTVARAAPAAVAAPTVVRAAPAAAAVHTVRQAAAVVLQVAAVADPRAAALQVHHQGQVQDVKLSLTAGIHPMIPAYLNFKQILL